MGRARLSHQHDQHGAGDCGNIDERDMVLVLKGQVGFFFFFIIQKANHMPKPPASEGDGESFVEEVIWKLGLEILPGTNGGKVTERSCSGRRDRTSTGI